MTRMMISGLFEPAEADRHEHIIREHLHFPDGVRLLNRPANFADGEIEWFRRAEQAAFFGREVGLMYAHAHIRWVEALAALGRADVGAELLRLSPINMGERIPSALPRQRTCYTSSSDATFPDRYTAARDFDQLRTGAVPTADGWRVYSSGPGIYLRQLLNNLLGLDERANDLVIAPNLRSDDDGLEIELTLAGRRRKVRYRVAADIPQVEVWADGRRIVGQPEPFRYRSPGLRIPRADLATADTLEIRTPPGA
jgi:cellobiose phosphorylase